MEEKIKNYIEEQTLFDTGKTILVAVSGGPDSMFLVHILRKLGYKVMIAHMNYLLRGQDSNEDALFVQHYCEDHGLTYFIHTADDSDLFQSARQNLQETARDMRYDWMISICISHNLTYIATGHTENDQAETILLNMIRGMGLQGAKGIPTSRTVIHENQTIYLQRPLLCISKQLILEYMEVHQLKYRLDYTNGENKYRRNKIRNIILPALEDIQLEATKHIAAFGEIIKSTLPLIEESVKQIKSSSTKKTGTLIRINTEPMHSKHLVYLLLNEYGLYPDQARQVFENLGKPGFMCTTRTHRIYTGHGQLHIQALDTESSNNKLIHSLPFTISLIGVDIQFTLVKEITIETNTVYLDASEIYLPLVLRKWLPGDRIAPLGMNGKHKKIQDVLTDQKITGFDKQEALVLDQQEEILWLYPTNTINEKFKVTKSTNVFLQIMLIPEVPSLAD